MKKIIAIQFNWFFSPIDNMENFTQWRVGEMGVTGIEHIQNYDDPGFYAVSFENGNEEWIYNPNRVLAQKVEPTPVTDEIPF